MDGTTKKERARWIGRHGRALDMVAWFAGWGGAPGFAGGVLAGGSEVARCLMPVELQSTTVSQEEWVQELADECEEAHLPGDCVLCGASA